MLLKIIRTELWKLKRYYILWAGVLLMLLSVILTLFTSTAEDGMVWDFRILIEQVIKNNTTTIFPMCITLIAGYMIAREEADDTLKNMRTIPVSIKELLLGKMVVCGIISVFFGLVCAAFTVGAVFLAGFPGFSPGLAVGAFVQMALNCLFLYLAVLPVIAVSARMSGGHLFGVVAAFVYGYGGMFASGSRTLSNIYPITASLGLINYRGYDSGVEWNAPLCAASLCVMTVLAAVVIGMSEDKREEGAMVRKKKEKGRVVKKGW